MGRMLAVLLALVVSAPLAVPVEGANWTKLGTSEFKMTVGGGPSVTPNVLKDRNRIKFGAIIVDPAGNVYAAANNAAQASAPEPAGVTIFKAGGGVINVDLKALGFEGPITKFVIGGDGLVYALQNYMQMQWDFAPAYTNRVIQITPDGTVTHIWCPDINNDGQCDVDEWASFGPRVNGLTVGGDGNVYFTSQSADTYWRIHYLWRYDVAQGVVEPSPMNGTWNNGWRIVSRMFDIEYVGVGDDGEDYFAVLRRHTPTDWDLNSIRWVENISGDPEECPLGENPWAAYYDGVRRFVFEGRSNTGWGRDWVMGMLYDPDNNKLYATARGAGGGASGHPIGGTTVVTRWNGIPDNPGLYTYFECGVGPDLDGWTHGLTGPQQVWHANRNNPLGTGVSNFTALGQYWIQANAINPEDGTLWTSYGADPSYIHNDLGYVTIHGVDNPVGEYYDAGKPEENAWVMGLAFHNGRAYALTLSFDTNEYSVYYTDDTTPQPRGPQIGEIKDGITGLTVTAEGVVTYPHPNAELNNFFYIQNDDRSSGIRVIPTDTATVVMAGDEVTVSGNLMQMGGEAAIINATVTVGPPAASFIFGGPEPLHVVTQNIGGSAMGMQPALAPGVGLNNVGLLVKISGEMTEYSSDEKGLFFRLDDGSNVKLVGDIPGIKVRGIPPAGQTGAFLTAVGVISTEWDMDEQKWLPVILTRDFADIELISN